MFHLDEFSKDQKALLSFNLTKDICKNDSMTQGIKNSLLLPIDFHSKFCLWGGGS